MLRSVFLILIPVVAIGFIAWRPFAATSEDSAVDSPSSFASSLGANTDIVFDSNRSGNFGIYRLSSSKGEVSKIFDSELHEMYPSPSPDGKKIVFARSKTLKREDPGEVWIANIDGSDARKLASPGTFPTFSSDGKTVYYELLRRKLMAVPVEGGESTELFPKQNKHFGNHFVIKPKVSPDSSKVSFSSDKHGRWNSWLADLATGELTKIERGCEPTWYPNSEQLTWVAKGKSRERSGLYGFKLGDNSRFEVQDADAPWGHEYFPEVSSNGKFLLFSACPPGQHSHYEANYELFMKNLESGELIQLTNEGHTNRWPSLLPR